MIGHPLVRKPVEPHPWRLHRWRNLEGMVGLFSVVRQCEKCWLVEVDNIMTQERVRGPHDMLKEPQ